MNFLKCFVALMSIYFCLMSCLSPEERKAREEARAKAIAAAAEARAKAEAEAREYNRLMDKAQIEEVTTCHHGSLDTVKKNLVFMGYDIETMDKQVLITKWHQHTSYNNGAKVFYKISVVKVDSNLIKFKTRERYEYPYTEQDKQVSTLRDGSYEQRLADKRLACRKDSNSEECQKEVVRKDTTSETVSYRKTFRVNEYEPTYYARNYDSFKADRDNICGVEPVKKVNTKAKNSKKNK